MTAEDFKAAIEEQERIFLEMDGEHGKELRASTVALETKFQEDLREMERTSGTLHKEQETAIGSLTTLTEESVTAPRDELETRTRNRDAVCDELSFRAPAMRGEAYSPSTRTRRRRSRPWTESSSALAGTETARWRGRRSSRSRP